MHPLVGSFVLVVAVSGLFAGLRSLLLRVGEARASVAAATSLAVLAGAVPTLARVTGIVGAVVVFGAVFGAVSVAAAIFVPKRKQPTMNETTTSPPWSRAAQATAVLLFVFLAVVALTTFLWDEASTHLPLAGAAARDLWPLEHPLFPGQPLRYHPGFAVTGGIVRAFTGLPLDLCLDTVTLIGFALLLWGIHDLACALGLTSSQAALVMVVVVLGGGPVAGLLADGWGSTLPGKGLFPSSWVSGATFPPLVVTNLFQHPQGLAFVIACAALVVASPAPRPGTSEQGRLAVAAALVLLCGRVQIIVAASMGLALLTLALRRRNARGLVILVVVAVVAAVDSGFADFKGAGAGFSVGGYFSAPAEDGAAVVVHVLLAFGFSLGAPFFALWLLRRSGAQATTAQRDLIVALAVIGTAGFVIGNVCHYDRSWDIVKFFGVSAFFAHFLLAAWLTRVRRSSIVVAVVVLSCWSGTFWLLRHGVLNGVVATAYREKGLPDDVADFTDRWSHRIGPHDRVFAPQFNLGGAGFLTPGTDWRLSRDTAALLLDRGLSERLHIAAKSARDFNAEALRQLKIRFVVVKSGAVAPALDDPRRFARLVPPDDGQPAGRYAVFEVLTGWPEAEPRPAVAP